MLRSVPIDNYFYGYNTRQFNCIEIPLAGLVGAFSYDNYYYYCFFRAVNNNWGNLQYSDFLSESNLILNKFGLNLKKYTIDNSLEFISFIKQSIEIKQPILWITNYYKLLYTQGYMNDSTSYHGTIINGYCTEKNIISIKEIVFGDVEAFSEITNAHALISFYLKDYYICDIWNQLNNYYKEINSPYYNAVFRLEKIDNIPAITFEQLLNGLINHDRSEANPLDIDNFKNDNLINLINSFNEIRIEIMDVSSYFTNLRQNLFGSLEAFFRKLETELKKNGLIQEVTSLNKFKEDYLSMRTNFLSILNAYTLRGKNIDEIKKEEFISKIKIKNNELADLINQWYKLNKQKRTKFVNFALGSLAWADSEHSNCISSNAINGKWDTWQTDLWFSNALKKEHWLKIDLMSSKHLIKFVICHFTRQGFITCDYEIQGSNDDKNWDTLVEVKGNSEAITTHDIDPCTYRYLKLYIMKPGNIDFHARIYEFEVWGENKI